MDGNAHGHGHAHTGHDHGVIVADFHRRFWISVVLTVPVLALSPMIQSFLGLREALAFAGSAYLLFALSAAVHFYGGWPFLSGLYDELGKRAPGMMTLIALVESDLGIAMGAGTDVAIEAADMVLVRSDPRDVYAILALSRATYGKMVQSLLWATGYNTFAIPLAAGIGYSWGFLLSPAAGAALMSLGTVIVAINAKLLERARRLVAHASVVT